MFRLDAFRLGRRVKSLNVVGLILLILWMAWISWRIEQTRKIAVETCGAVYADIESWNLKNKTRPPQHPYDCPFVDLAVQP